MKGFRVWLRLRGMAVVSSTKVAIFIIRNPRLTLRLALVVVALVAALLLLIVAVVAIPAQLLAAATAPSEHALEDIPPTALAAYTNAEAFGCDGLPWQVIAGIGKVESNHGYGNIAANGDVTPRVFGPELDGSGVGGNITAFPAGRWAGRWGTSQRWLQGLGPMQFLAPTWSIVAVDGNSDGDTSPHNLFDAAAGTAAYLCNGGDINDYDDLEAAIYRYNRSKAYVAEVLHHATLYGSLQVTADAESLVSNPHITLSHNAQADLEAGIVDPRLVTMLAMISERYEIFVRNFRTGYPGPDGEITNHWFGRAADITAVSPLGETRQPISATNDPARELVGVLADMPVGYPFRPDEVRSPFAEFGGVDGHSAGPDYRAQITIGYNSEASSDIINDSEASKFGMSWPVTAPARITSPFGLRIHPIHGTRKMHTGVDLAAPHGAPIWAASDGAVIHVGWRGGYGNTVEIDHGSGITTLYAHLSSTNVEVGQQVVRGAMIGASGQTGTATGPHLHFEVRQNNTPTNPLPFLP